MNKEEICNKIEAILFTKAEPIKFKELCKILNISLNELKDFLKDLELSFSNHAFCLVINNDEVALGIKPLLGNFLEEILKEELNKDLTRAGLETLTVILYKNGCSKNEIDWIRGVNSAFILRNLLIRGLIKREVDENDKRKFIYKPTVELLSYLGLEKVEDLPNYSEFKELLEKKLKENINFYSDFETNENLEAELLNE